MQQQRPRTQLQTETDPLASLTPSPPLFSCLFPATATQQNKSCSEIHHLSWLGCLLRSFVRLQIFRARDLTALASSPAWFLCHQPKVPPAPAGRLFPPRAPAAKPHNRTPYASTTTSLPTSRALSPTLLREFYPKARPCNEPQLQDPLPQHAVPLPQRHDSRRKSHHVGINKLPPRASGRYTQPTGTSTSTTPCICGIRARRVVRPGELQAVPTGP